MFNLFKYLLRFLYSDSNRYSFLCSVQLEVTLFACTSWPVLKFVSL